MSDRRLVHMYTSIDPATFVGGSARPPSVPRVWSGVTLRKCLRLNCWWVRFRYMLASLSAWRWQEGAAARDWATPPPPPRPCRYAWTEIGCLSRPFTTYMAEYIRSYGRVNANSTLGYESWPGRGSQDGVATTHPRRGSAGGCRRQIWRGGARGWGRTGAKGVDPLDLLRFRGSFNWLGMGQTPGVHAPAAAKSTPSLGDGSHAPPPGCGWIHLERSGSNSRSTPSSPVH